MALSQAQKDAKRRREIRRKDPRFARNVGVPSNILQNEDKRFHYVLAYMGNKESGAEYYAGLGYKVVKYEGEKGPHFIGSEQAMGQPIEYRGHVLMCLPKKEHESIVDFGAEGNTGQAMVDDIEEMILDQNKSVMFDPSRGFVGQEIRNKYFSVENESKDEGSAFA